MKYYLKCKNFRKCGNIVERDLRRKIVTCFPCKSQRHIKYQKKYSRWKKRGYKPPKKVKKVKVIEEKINKGKTYKTYLRKSKQYETNLLQRVW